MKKILGFDQSFTSSGYCIVDESGEVIKFGTVKTKDGVDGDIYDRGGKVAIALISLAETYDVSLIGMEGLAFSKFGSATRDLAGLQFILIDRIRRDTEYGKNLVIVPPNLLKKFATGKGNSDKAEMAAVLPAILIKDIAEQNFKKTTGLYDIADAYHIAMYTLAEYKHNK